MKPSHASLLVGVLLCVLPIACAIGPDIQSTATAAARQRQVETESAGIAATQVVLSATQTALAAPTATLRPTSTPLTPTATPGPLVIDDDFSELNPRWSGCDVCSIKNGELVVGPYPSTDSAKGYITLCGDCGLVHEYKMSVDATFVSGVSDRGFGLVLREGNGSYIDLEITTWQVYGVWLYDKKGGGAWNAWHSLLSKGFAPTGALNAGVHSNHIAVYVHASDTNRRQDLIEISINGRLLNTLQFPRSAGYVGLGVGLHSIGVAFDNFHFEGIPLPPGDSSTFSG